VQLHIYIFVGFFGVCCCSNGE